MQPLPANPNVPEPPDEQHPGKGRCMHCGQRLQRLWIWTFGAWQADRWCDACFDTVRQKEIATRREAIAARRTAAAKEAANA